MHALPFVVGLVVAVALTRPVLAGLRSAGATRPNHRGRVIPSPLGLIVPAAALAALVPLLLIARLAPAALFYPQLGAIALYVLGVALLGLADDRLEPASGAAPRGWRGHARAALRGRPGTGALKAVGALALALLAAGQLPLSNGRWLLASAVLALATNAFNVLDLRPGRTLKGFVLLVAGISAGARELRPLWTIGVFAAPALVAGAVDLRERAMLGDTGANVIGALAGLMLVLSLGADGQLIALGVLLAMTLYAEFFSLSALIARTPLLRQLDCLGRPS